MHDDDEFLRTIPPFLRRYQEPPPRKLPVRPRDLPAARSPSEPRLQPRPTAAPAPAATPSATPVATAAPAAPTAPATPTAPAASDAAKVVEMAQPLAAEGPAAQRARIALAFENESLDSGPAQGTAQSMVQGTIQGTIQGTDAEDAAFQVTLPRGVVRQIRMLAAEQDTTQRAVVLRALRLAGLSVPDGSDVDRRGRAAKRQA